jgi:CYTH domain
MIGTGATRQAVRAQRRPAGYGTLPRVFKARRDRRQRRLGFPIAVLRGERTRAPRPGRRPFVGSGALASVAFLAGLTAHRAFLLRRRRRTRPIETESTLVVVADSPEEVVRRVAALTELEGFVLRPRPDEAIHDLYFDTPDASLAAARSSLRLREVGTRRVLTIKGPPRSGSFGATTRDELEGEWPERAWKLLRTELAAVLVVPAAPPPGGDPVEALESLGLVVVQERATSRRVRDVDPHAAAPRPVAELAVDVVAFQLPGGPVRHREVEVEAKSAGGDAAVALLTESLVRQFWPGLRPWRLGKLATGKAVAELIERQALEPRAEGDALADDGSVRPWVYDLIANAQVSRSLPDGASS